MTTLAVRACTSLIATALVAGTALSASAQTQAKSASLTAELTKLLQQRKLDSVAARHPDSPDEFAAALFFPGQLLVVTARTTAPAILNEKLLRAEYRDVYIDLNSASIPESRMMFTDGNADGLRPDREDNQPFDMVDSNGSSIRFDGEWRGQKMSEEEYRAAFKKAEASYITALTALVAELKKSS